MSLLETPGFILVVLLLFAFIPPIAFLIWTRNSEKYAREPWLLVFKVFLWGAVFAVIIAVLIESILVSIYGRVVPVYVAFGNDPTIQSLVLAMIIAPFVEEGAKALGIYTASYAINEVQDGIVYGAASGFGFSATENLLYGFAAFLAFDPRTAIVLIVLRSISSTLLHASATSVTGLGVGKHLALGGRHRVAPYYLLAVAMHSSFNLLASLGELYQNRLGDLASAVGVMAACIFAVVAFGLVRGRIHKGEGPVTAW